MVYRFIGASIGHAAGITGCEDAPDLIKNQLDLNKLWHKTVYFKGKGKGLAILDDVALFSNELAQETYKISQLGKFITFGGDHSCAIGTWSGAYQTHKEFGLIWIDAHMDSHTPESSSSGNIHGMPLATLLGSGDKKLTNILSNNPKLKPENVVLLGIRSYEAEEEKLLNNLGVKIFKMQDIEQIGFQNCFKEILNQFQKKNLKFGITLDLDGLDPKYIKALGTPVPCGIKLPEMLESFKLISEFQLIGVEITEYNPKLDTNYSGIKLIKDILLHLPGFKFKE